MKSYTGGDHFNMSELIFKDRSNLIWLYRKKAVHPMRCVMPFSIQDGKLNVFLLIVKSGLFQMGEWVVGASVEFVILLKFHQAIRVIGVIILLKHGCFLID